MVASMARLTMRWYAFVGARPRALALLGGELPERRRGPEGRAISCALTSSASARPRAARRRPS